MQVVELLPPKAFAGDRFRMTARLPEAALPVCHRLGAQGLGKAPGSVPGTVIAQLPARELAQIGQRSFQSLAVPVGIKDDHMQVRGHNDVGLHTELFVAMTEAQAFGHDLASPLRHEHRQPFHHRVGQVIEGRVSVDSVAFHAGIVRRQPFSRQTRGQAGRL